MFPTEPEPPGRPASLPFKSILLGHAVATSSQVRLRSELLAEDERRQACQLLDALSDEVLTLAVNTDALGHALGHTPGEWTKRVASIVRPSLRVLSHVADATLDVLRVFSAPEAAPLLANGGPLGDYLRGVLAWWRGTLTAFEGLAAGPRTRQAYWLLRHRLDHARAFLFPELATEALVTLAGIDAAGELADTLEALVLRAGVLGLGLREPRDEEPAAGVPRAERVEEAVAPEPEAESLPQ